jgi:3-methyladenine DNA glycosylase AlkD
MNTVAMNTVGHVMTELESKGTEQTRKTFARHGVRDVAFGVKVADLKVIAKKIKGEQELAYELYETGNYDAMYLAGLVVDGSQMTKKQLETWAKTSTYGPIAQYTVPWVATESPHSRVLALKWIKSKSESIATSGWNTYAGMIAVTPDEELDLDEIKQLIDQVVDQIDSAPNNVRYTMNGFVISVGTYVKPLLKKARAAAKKIGTVTVDMGDTACKVPNALTYIAKVEDQERTGKKRKTIKC